MADVQFNLRVPAELKDKVRDAAEQSGRSINAEAQYRLEQSFSEVENIFKITSKQTTVSVPQEVFERLVKILNDDEKYSANLNK